MSIHYNSEERRQGIFDLLKKYDRSLVLIFTAAFTAFTMYFTVQQLQKERVADVERIVSVEKDSINFKIFMASQLEINKKMQEVSSDVRDMLRGKFKN